MAASETPFPHLSLSLGGTVSTAVCAGARAHRDRGGWFPDRHPHHPHRGHRSAVVGSEGCRFGGPEGDLHTVGGDTR